MKERKPTQADPPLGATPLRELLNREHPLCRLAGAIHWQVFEEEFGPRYAEGVGRARFTDAALRGLALPEAPLSRQ